MVEGGEEGQFVFSTHVNQPAPLPPPTLLQYALGQCNALFLRFADAASRTVVQYCSDVCGCSDDSKTGASAAGASSTSNVTTADAGTVADKQAEPRVMKFDGGATERVAAAVEAAANAARVLAPVSAADWERWDGCCASPVRLSANSYEVDNAEVDV